MESVRDSFEIEYQSGGIETTSGLTVSAFPNPTRGLLTLESDQGGALRVSLYDLRGMLLFEDQEFEPGHHLDLRGKPAGSYILRVQVRNRTGAIIIQKL